MLGARERNALAVAIMSGIEGVIWNSIGRYVGSSPVGFESHPWTRSKRSSKGHPGAKLAKKAAKGTVGITHPR